MAKTRYEEYEKLAKQNEAAQKSDCASNDLKAAFKQAAEDAKKAAKEEAEEAKRARSRR